MKNFKTAITSVINKNSSRKYLADFAKQAAKATSPGARVLDAGAGECPYGRFFRHAKLDTTDLCLLERPYEKLSYISDLARIPVRDESYDLVFCSQTLEHVKEPHVILSELNRILKPGGELWLSAPLFYEEHEIPYDYFRFTRYGLAYLLEQANFEINQLTWLEGYYGTLSYQLRLGAIALPLKPGDYGGRLRGMIMVFIACFIKLIFGVISILFTYLDIHYKFTGAGLCKNYSIIANKHTKEDVDINVFDYPSA